MVNLTALRHTIASAPVDRPVAGAVSLNWLKEVERDLTELAALRQRSPRRARA
jgi:hypothetical protein